MKLYARSLMAATLATLALGCTSNKSDNSVNATNAPAIIGGQDVVEGSTLQKSVVGIFDMERGALCTGSLLENNIVLTAAHCIGDKPEAHIIIFAADLLKVFQSKDRDYVLSVARKATKTLSNPEWGKQHSGSEAWGDTALIKFAGTIPAGFAPATMLAANVLAENMMITVAGYGVNSDIITEVNPADYPDFQDRVQKGEFFCDMPEEGDASAAGVNENFFSIVKSELAPEASTDAKPVVKCYKEELSGEGILRTTDLKVLGAYNDTEVVFDQQYGQAACEGDSGGPAYVNVNGAFHLFGVTSRGTRGCNGYVLYSDVSTPKLAQWLNDAKVEISK